MQISVFFALVFYLRLDDLGNKAIIFSHKLPNPYFRGPFCYSFYNKLAILHSLFIRLFEKGPACVQLLDIFVNEVFQYCLLLSMYSVKREKQGVASNQEATLRPAEPQAISCVLAVRQDG